MSLLNFFVPIVLYVYISIVCVRKLKNKVYQKRRSKTDIFSATQKIHLHIIDSTSTFMTNFFVSKAKEKQKAIKEKKYFNIFHRLIGFRSCLLRTS